MPVIVKVRPADVRDALLAADLNRQQVCRALNIPIAWANRALGPRRYRFDAPNVERMEAMVEYCRQYRKFRKGFSPRGGK